jgi:hypothetical protein
MNLDFTKDYSTNSVLAEGWYDVYVDGAEYKTSKSTNVDYLNLKLKTKEGKVIFGMYNLFNKNDIARNIALNDIKTILTLQGSDVAKLKSVSKDDLLELLTNNKIFQVALSVVENEFGKQNRIKKYKESEVKEILKAQETTEAPPF